MTDVHVLHRYLLIHVIALLSTCLDDSDQEIDCRVRMVKIVERLPHYLQIKWRKEAVRGRESSGDYPSIEVLLVFLEEASSEVNDSVFGVTSKGNKMKMASRPWVG